MSFGQFFILKSKVFYGRICLPNQLNINLGAIFLFYKIVAFAYTHNVNLIKIQILSI